MLTVFPLHAPGDALFARELCTFLESGCDLACAAEDAVIKPGRDLFSTAELGQSADVLILLLSNASNPRAWPREIWERLWVTDPAEAGTQVAVFQLEECRFPDVLKKGSRYFNAAADGGGAAVRLLAMRRLKRWLRGVQTGAPPAMQFSPDLEILYSALADGPGMFTASGKLAERFAHEAARDFDAVLWVPSHGRTLTQITGDLGSQLQITLEDRPTESQESIRELLAARRCLVIFDAPQVAVDVLLPSGRSSVLFTTEPVQVVNERSSLVAARGLFSAARFAEAYEMYYELLNAGADADTCARDLIWICERWDRTEEANTLRFHLGPSPSQQLRLF